MASFLHLSLVLWGFCPDVSEQIQKEKLFLTKGSFEMLNLVSHSAHPTTRTQYRAWRNMREMKPISLNAIISYPPFLPHPPPLPPQAGREPDWITPSD